ncbi:nonstructural protein [Tortoise microvirus 21]|nr:nonstructural protein [Tortoise microvirus 21]
MKNNVYAIYDRVAEESGPLFEAKNDLMAWRMVLGAKLNIAFSEIKLLKLGTYSHDPVYLTSFSEPIEVVKTDVNVEETA